MAGSNTGSVASSTTSLDSEGKKKTNVCNPLGRKGKEGKWTDYINTLEISNPEHGSSKEAVVVLHGYAAALGYVKSVPVSPSYTDCGRFFFRNWESVAQSAESTNRRTFFLDWLGMGLSSRPSPNLLSSPSSATMPARVARAEHFFLASLEAWRQSVGVEKMILVGHSLGGYLASAYTVRYPERVSGLILVSPAGVPRGPEYKRFPTSEEVESAGGLDGMDVAEMEAHGAGPATKAEPVGEAKKWQQDRDTSAFRRNMAKCRSYFNSLTD
jgi:cardiolipin-specific phospholipase